MPSFANVENVVKGVVSLIALLPGLALITRAIQLPLDLQQLMGGLALTAGVLVVLAVYLFGGRLKRLSAQKVGIAVLALGVVGLATSVYAFSYIGEHTIERSVDGETVQLVVPDRPTGQLATDMVYYQGDYVEAMHDPINGGRIARDIHAQAKPTLWAMIFWYTVAQTLLLAAMVLGAWKVADVLERRRGAARPTEQAA
ncbi:hypothetical protein [Brevundimonas lenta]|uniref:Uncharacterized protein n=1 Tax=Brevundimonas lenta TaxID=424796 RepID=A0A7W6JBX5_9CAUL|nr:hypothetical protein [Brevundimonas lenta]MBB4081372.1 hypothetical protein [Brevundimonas lenta]